VVDEDIAIKLGAFKCAIEFGLYNAEKHPQGFLTKILENYVPKYFAQQRKTEQNILKEWKLILQKTDIIAESVKGYLELAAKEIKQFGCATVDAKILKVDKEEFYTPVFFSVSKIGCIFITVDGSVVLEGKWADMVVDFTQEDKFTVKGTKTILAECSGIQSFKLVIEFIKAVNYPT
jgi:hypothetical protein